MSEYKEEKMSDQEGLKALKKLKQYCKGRRCDDCVFDNRVVGQNSRCRIQQSGIDNIRIKEVVTLEIEK